MSARQEHLTTKPVTTEPVDGSATHGPANEVRGLVSRFRHLFHELGKFGVVGVVAYAVDSALLLAIDLHPLLDKTISTAVAATVAFIGNRFWTWRHRERSGLRREYSLYFLFNLAGLGIGLACLGISHYGLGQIWPVLQTEFADLISANVIGMVFGTLFRFWSYRRFVFRQVAGSGSAVAPAVGPAEADAPQQNSDRSAAG